jgi:hypothetical protein
LTEDKADINVRVAWSGVGINLATNEPTPQALREAIRNVLDSRTIVRAPRSWPKSSPASIRDPKFSGFLNRSPGFQTKIKAVASRVDN